MHELFVNSLILIIFVRYCSIFYECSKILNMRLELYGHAEIGNEVIVLPSGRQGERKQTIWKNRSRVTP